MHVDKNVEQGLSKLKTAQNQNTRVIRTALENLRNKLKPGINHVSASKETQSAITQQLKLYHAYISKYTKVLDKVCSYNFDNGSLICFSRYLIALSKSSNDLNTVWFTAKYKYL